MAKRKAEGKEELEMVAWGNSNGGRNEVHEVPGMQNVAGSSPA